MTYQVLKMVLEWAVVGASNQSRGEEYRKAMAELEKALIRVIRFH